jgi:hypothetical protein
VRVALDVVFAPPRSSCPGCLPASWDRPSRPAHGFYAPGAWRLDDFSAALATHLAKYNVRVVAKNAVPDVVAEIDLGVPGIPRTIDVYLVQDTVRTYAGRVRVTHLSMATLDGSARLLAPVIAGRAWERPEVATPE